MSWNNSNSSEALRRLKFSHLYWSGNTGDGFFLKPQENAQWGPVIVIPLLATIILAASVFLLVIFRQNPTFVISTIAGCLVFIAVYLILCALQSSRQFFD